MRKYTKPTIRFSKYMHIAQGIYDEYAELEAYKSRRYVAKTAKEYGVSRQTIYDIINRQGCYSDLISRRI